MTSVLGLGALLAAPGCLVPEVPEYTPPQRTPPFIDPSSVTPSPYHLLRVTQNSVHPISWDVHSEDAGEPLVGALRYDLFSDLGHISDQSYAPSTFAAGPRKLSMSFQVRTSVPVGCQVLTLLVMHSRSYDTQTDLPRTNAWGDVAFVNWTMQVSSPDLESDPRLSDCPIQGESGVANAEVE